MTKKSTNSVPADEPSRRRIREALDVTILVEAAAGTGKTTCLIDRMTSLLAQGKCQVDSLAAVTFTRKAAAELRARFQVALERRAASETDPQRTDRLREAASHVERSFIGTIHSFCARLLRERPVEAGVDVAFKEIDEDVDLRLRRQAWEQFVAELLASDDPLSDQIQQCNLDWSGLAKAFEDFAGYPDVQDWPAPPVDLPNLAATREELQNYLEHIRELAPDLPEDAAGDKLIPAYRRLIRRAAYVDLDDDVEIMDLLEMFKHCKVVQYIWPSKPQAKAEEQRWDGFCENFAQPALNAWRARRYAVAIKALVMAREVYDRLRRELGVLNYQDLLMKAAHLLRNRPNIRRYFRRRFTRILVDEFQDTDPIQAEMLLLLTAGDPNQSDWRECRPDPGSLFVVGDPKQSIYRFRRADIVTYNAVKKIIHAVGGEVIELSTNFRTIEPVVRWVNAVSAELFPAKANDCSPQDVPLTAARSEDPAGCLAGVIRLDAPGTKQDEICQAEADLIARYIRWAIDTRQPVPRSRKELDQGVSPTATPGDFLIITQQKKRMTVYAEKLQRLGIPHEVTGGSSLNQVHELRLLHACLAAVCHPDNPVALLAALRGELFGFNDRQLYTYKKAGGRFSFHASIPEGLSQADRDVISLAFDRLKRYAEWLKRMPAVSAVEKITIDLGLPALAASRTGGNVHAGSLAKAVELLRAAQVDQWTAADLVAYLGQLVEQEEKYDGIPAQAHGRPAVRIMNLHKAKGLESPVVFLADPSGEFDHGVKLCIDRQGDRVFGYMAIYGEKRGDQAPPLLAHPVDWAGLSDAETKFQEAERNRRLYVAATRAGTQMVISQREGKQGRNPWGEFNAALAECPALSDPGEQPAAASESAAIAVDEPVTADTARQQRWSSIAKPGYAVVAAKSLAVRGRLEPDGGREHGTEIGTVVHLLLQTAMESPQTDLRPLAESALAEQELDRSLANSLVLLVQRVTQSDLWRRAMASPRRFVEFAFQKLGGPNDNLPVASPPTIVRGVIDLVFQEEAGWVIVDFKTDDGAGRDLAELVSHYAAQVHSYARAWTEITGQPVGETGLFFVNGGHYVTC